eukprot:CAMPEP_0173437412 /NCGR_PEP_ID=MMETSP1357-20121228/18013_1 /TAXON_ID=77926 /ORGANISM="Hemiselmis rufescens, Strain PCC563" /LENGTH=242 /DNA_ID=CAMNT_0014402591 /DNA_START=24 /DNA_END=749 /DNA_ORIENTATION=+
MGQPARDFTVFVISGRNLPLVDTQRGPGPANAYCALTMLHPGDPVPEESLVTENTKGTPTSAVTAHTNPCTFNSEIVMRKQVTAGSTLLLTVWHRAAPGSGQKGNLKLGKVQIPLPPQEGPIATWHGISDDQGNPVQGAGGLAEVYVQLVMPGQTRIPIAPQPTQPTVVAQPKEDKPVASSAKPVEGSTTGYTNEQIKEALVKEKEDAEAEERNQMEDINDDLLRAAEIEEALLQSQKRKGG